MLPCFTPLSYLIASISESYSAFDGLEHRYDETVPFLPIPFCNNSSLNSKLSDRVKHFSEVDEAGKYFSPFVFLHVGKSRFCKDAISDQFFSREETNLAFMDHFCASLGSTLSFGGEYSKTMADIAVKVDISIGLWLSSSSQLLQFKRLLTDLSTFAKCFIWKVNFKLSYTSVRQ